MKYYLQKVNKEKKTTLDTNLYEKKSCFNETHSE